MKKVKKDAGYLCLRDEDKRRVIMMNYKVVNLQSPCSTTIQKQIKEMVSNRVDIIIKSVNIWSALDITYATVIYVEQDFNL